MFKKPTKEVKAEMDELTDYYKNKSNKEFFDFIGKTNREPMLDKY